MDYTAENLDVEKLEDAIHAYRDNNNFQLTLAQEKARAFYEGYEKAMSDVRGMFHCCNYESESKKTRAFLSGFDSAIYDICKELDVPVQDIREMNISDDEKAALVAERIKATFREEN